MWKVDACLKQEIQIESCNQTITITTQAYNSLTHLFTHVIENQKRRRKKSHIQNRSRNECPGFYTFALLARNVKRYLYSLYRPEIEGV